MIFAAILMIVTLLTDFISLLDLVFFRAKIGPENKEGKIVEYAKSFFPVLLVVFLIRSFVV